MIPIGYMYKKVEVETDWLENDIVIDIYSVSSCISEDFADYINDWKYYDWKHNGYWLFDSPEIIESFAKEQSIDLSGTTLFYYEAYEYEYNANFKNWMSFTPEASFVTEIRIPTEKYLKGYDVATFSGHNTPECSPLSCNGLATDISVNKHCLFNTFEEAKKALEQGVFENSEPGPYRIIAVYTITP
jgi:hypothetical protein